MERDPGDIIDRWSIAKLKKEKIGEDESIKEYQHFEEGIDELKKIYSNINWELASKHIYDINAAIWSLEFDLRKGKLDNNMDRCGDRSILIRGINKLRVGFKNFINDATNSGFIDIKRDHLSE